MNNVFISICIPAYKRVDFLKRLLDSIAIQTFREYEVIISDDSPADEVKELIRNYHGSFPALVYQKNTPPQGMPSNWNEVIRKANGQWIKLMHDDDWFATPDALQKFANAAKAQKGTFIFSAYYDVFLSKGQEKKVRPPAFRLRELRKHSVTLLSRNIIGPPSVVMHRNDGLHFYDTNLKWLVDIDMYIQRLKDDQILYVPEALIKVGVGDDQVTASVHGVPQVEVPEHFYFLSKTGINKLRHILVYDYWWRFIRNFRLFTPAIIAQYGYKGTLHPVLLKMMTWQKEIPAAVLKKGIFSKIIMFVHFCLYRKQL
jgi:glycosyltransferase involved in cell wall biosynthesis